MAIFLVLHGPNLNLLGSREPTLYGGTSLDAINTCLKQQAEKNHHQLISLQSNAEWELINAIQQAPAKSVDLIIINPAAFTQPALGTLGNSGRASLLGPGFWEIDTALSRIFRVREGMNFELRGEAFNLTNSFRAGSPGQPTVITAINNQNFGKILTAQDPRIMQLALKFVFWDTKNVFSGKGI